jgi:zinc transport system permease protein
MRLAFTVLLAIVVAIAMRVIGVLLITALLIIPAATARLLARTPEAMAAFAAATGVAAVVCGLGLSYWIDTPSGPSVVVAALCLFMLVQVARVAGWRVSR